MSRQRLQRRDSQRFGVVGAGAIATVLSLYHFLSQVANDAPHVAAQIQPTAPSIVGSIPTLHPTTYALPTTNPATPTNMTAAAWNTATQGYAAFHGMMQPSTTAGVLTTAGTVNSVRPAADAAASGSTLAFSLDPIDSLRAIAAELLKARKQVLYMARNVHSEMFAAALVETHRRGVPVYVILDSNAQPTNQSAAEYFAAAQVRTSLVTDQSLGPMNLLLIDGETAIFGSFDAPDRRSGDQIVVSRMQTQVYDTFESSFLNMFRRSIAFHGVSAANRSAGYGTSPSVLGYTTSALGASGGPQPVSQAIMSDRPNLAQPPRAPSFR